MRILSWNINGVRTLPQYHPWNEFKTFDDVLNHISADIICFQGTSISRLFAKLSSLIRVSEIKSARQALPPGVALPPSYDAFFSLPTRKSGYSGVAVYTRRSVVVPRNAEEGLLRPKQTHGHLISSDYPSLDPDDPADLDHEGRALVLDFGLFVLINVYCPNDSGTPERERFKMAFHTLLERRVQNLIDDGREVIVLGDINATPAVQDHCEGPLIVSRSPNDPDAFWSPPYRRWIREWLISDSNPNPTRARLVDIVRQFWPDRKGMYTCWNTKISARASNYGTRIDFILVTPKLVPWIKSADIQQDVKGSDHCPVYIDLHDQIVAEDGTTLHLKDLINSPPPSSSSSSATTVTENAPQDPPRLATKYWEEFSGKQTLLSTFFTKKKKPSPTSSNSGTTPTPTPPPPIPPPPSNSSNSQPQTPTSSSPFSLSETSTIVPTHDPSDSSLNPTQSPSHPSSSSFISPTPTPTAPLTQSPAGTGKPPDIASQPSLVKSPHASRSVPAVHQERPHAYTVDDPTRSTRSDGSSHAFEEGVHGNLAHDGNPGDGDGDELGSGVSVEMRTEAGTKTVGRPRPQVASDVNGDGDNENVKPTKKLKLTSSSSMLTPGSGSGSGSRQGTGMGKNVKKQKGKTSVQSGSIASFFAPKKETKPKTNKGKQSAKPKDAQKQVEAKDQNNDGDETLASRSQLDSDTAGDVDLDADYRLALQLSQEEEQRFGGGKSSTLKRKLSCRSDDFDNELSSQPAAGGSGQSQARWASLFTPTETPRCTVHDEPTKELTVNKSGPNKGKRFFVCARPVGPGYDKGPGERPRQEVDHQWKCNYFKWATDVRREMNNASGGLSNAAHK